MTQQQMGIVGIVDVDVAFETGTLKGCSYFFGNGGPFGSTGLGTDHLVSVVHGTSWSDGSQAAQQILNLVIVGVTSLPTTLPRNYAHIQAALSSSRRAGESRAVLQVVPFGTRVLLDQTGHRLSGRGVSEDDDVAQVPPIVTDITGEAVEQQIIFPAQYGSPDLVNGGWYWSATIATSRPGIWTYTLHVLLQRPRAGADVSAEWERLTLTCDASLDIRNHPMRNGFTGAGIGFLPMELQS